MRVQVAAVGACSSEDVERAIATARAVAAVDDDPTEFFAMVRRHALLGPLARDVDPRIASTPTVFESFAVAVIEQLVTTFEARASTRRLWRIAGEPVPNTELCAAPTGAAVKRVPMWKMHAIGVGSRRAVTLHEGAGRADALERLRAHSPEVAVEKLQSLRGVGPWTANAVARSGLGWVDAVPVGDFHAPYTITAALGGRGRSHRATIPRRRTRRCWRCWSRSVLTERGSRCSSSGTRCVSDAGPCLASIRTGASHGAIDGAYFRHSTR